MLIILDVNVDGLVRLKEQGFRLVPSNIVEDTEFTLNGKDYHLVPSEDFAAFKTKIATI